MPEDKIETFKLVELVESPVSDLKDYVERNNPSESKLHQLLEAEKAGKDRKTAKKFLKKQLSDEEIGEKVEEARRDIEEVLHLLGNVQDPEQLEEATEEIGQEKLFELIGGTVADLEEYVENHQLTGEQLETILQAEKAVKDRKTAENFLTDQIKKVEVGKDVVKAEEDLEKLEEDLEEVEELETSEDDEEPEGEEDSEDETDSDEEQESEDEDSGEDSEEESEEDGEAGDEEEEPDDESEEGEEEADEEEETAEDEEPGDEETEEDQEEEEEESELEQKKDILEELDVEMSEEELEEISIEELEQIRDEKEEREELIDQLSEEFDEEALRESSTEDLEKLKKEIVDGETYEEEEDQGSDGEDDLEDFEIESGGIDEGDGKSDKEIKEEAEADLKMLMGAKREGEEDEEDDSGRFEAINEAKEKLQKVMNRSSEEEDEEEGPKQGVDKDRALEFLEEYSELDDHEAAIKTAHVMKSFLEYRRDIERELTYKELAEELKSEEDQNIQTLFDFFSRMAKMEYTGQINYDVEKAIEASKKVVEESK